MLTSSIFHGSSSSSSASSLQQAEHNDFSMLTVALSGCLIIGKKDHVTIERGLAFAPPETGEIPRLLKVLFTDRGFSEAVITLDQSGHAFNIENVPTDTVESVMHAIVPSVKKQKTS